MALAALIVSILALITAGASAIYTRRQAVHSQKLAEIEGDRRHEERTPVLDAEIEAVKDSGWYRMWLRLKSREPLTSIRAEIVEGHGMFFPQGQNGVDSSGKHPKVAEWGDLEPMDAACWRVEIEKERSNRVQLRVRCSAKDAQWIIPVEVELPYDIAFSIY